MQDFEMGREGGRGEQESSMSIVTYEMHMCLLLESGGVPPPPGKFLCLHPLTRSGTKFPNILMIHTYVQ